MPSAQQMHMQMVDRLAPIRPGIDHNTIAAIQPRGARHGRSRPHQVTQQRRMGLFGMCLRRDMLLGNNQQMRGRLRMNIRKAQAQLVLIDALGRDNSGHNLAK